MEEMKNLIDVGEALDRVRQKIAFIQTVLTAPQSTDPVHLEGDDQTGAFWIFEDIQENISQIGKVLDKIEEEARQKDSAKVATIK